ncbi:BatD family protein [Marinihelvus fidelis]|uniref:BatD family protein n=1 Tax=Marinihelvus fidelis TaxID=2613842 RepID=UPI00177F633B|nr:BatD family protein [Marinihelvus fidelis]
MRQTNRNPRWALASLLVWLCCWPALGALAATVEAVLDRDRAVVGETVTLALQTDDSAQSLDADLSALDGDFILLDRRTETRMSITNGRQVTVKRLVVTLEPQRAGTLTIPAMQFPGGASTAPVSLEVTPAPEAAPGEAPPVFIELELEPVEGPYYVHAQIALKVRIFYQQNLTEASVSPPAPDQASVRLLDEVPYTADRNGERYRVLERRYAVFPERSGELVIPSMQLTGRLVERSGDRLWQPTVRGRRVRVESEPLVLDIQPRPPAYSGDHWLPARALSASQQITDADEVHVGEPVTRTVIIDAVGLEEHMLEEPAWPDMPNARIYPDQPQGISRDDGQWVLGHREFRYAVVPEQAGELLLPELRISWWDTANNRQRVAVLPEQRVTVLPSATPVTAPAGPAPGAGERQVGTTIGGHWPWIALGFAVLWLLTLGLWWLRPRGRSAASARPRAAVEDPSRAMNDFQAACRANDAAAARRHLSRWLRHDGPRQAGGRLRTFARRLDEAGEAKLAGQVRALDGSGFQVESDDTWQGESLRKTFEQWYRSGQALGKAPAVAGEGAGAPDLWDSARRD